MNARMSSRCSATAGSFSYRPSRTRGLGFLYSSLATQQAESPSPSRCSNRLDNPLVTDVEQAACPRQGAVTAAACRLGGRRNSGQPDLPIGTLDQFGEFEGKPGHSLGQFILDRSMSGPTCFTQDGCRG